MFKNEFQVRQCCQNVTACCDSNNEANSEARINGFGETKYATVYTAVSNNDDE